VGIIAEVPDTDVTSGSINCGQRRQTHGAVRLSLVAVGIVALGGVRVLVQNDAWTIPPDATQRSSPLSATPSVLKDGKSVFTSRCEKCHGADGAGNGPASDPKHPAANLTDASHASENPDGVLFYKIWNGRKPMPAFKTELTRDKVWAVVEYVKSIRRK
jgi:mono/diheme cytochrome c family protein